MIPLPDDFVSEYHLYGSRVNSPRPQTSMYDGIDTSIEGIGDLAPEVKWLRESLHALAEQAVAADRHYLPNHPEAVVPDLLKGLKATRMLIEKARGAGLEDVRFELQIKERQWQRALATACGWSFSAVVRAANGSRGGPFSGPDPTSLTIVPSQSFTVENQLTNGGRLPAAIESMTVAPASGEAWPISIKGALPHEAKPASQVSAQFQVTVPADAKITRPYFSRPDEEQPYYDIGDESARNLSFAPYPLVATARVKYEGETIELRQYVEAIHRDEPSAVEADPILVEPAISVSVSPRAGAVPLSAHAFSLSCVLHSNVKGAAKGTLHLRLPEGWLSEPAEYSFDLPGDGASDTVTFEIRPRNIQAKAYDIKEVAEYAGKSY